MTHNIYRDGVVHVMSEECKSCIFRPHDRPVAGARVAEMIRETLEEDGSTIVCHSTLYDLDGKDDQAHAICRGWYDRLGDRDPILRLAEADHPGAGIMTDATVDVLIHLPRDVYRALMATADRLSEPLRPVRVHTLIEVAVCRSVRGEPAREAEEALLAVPDNAPRGLTPEIARKIRLGRAQYRSDREIAERIGTVTQPTITRYRGLLGLSPIRPRTGGGRRKAES